MSSLCFALRAGGKIWFADWVGMQTFICTGTRGIHALGKNTIQVEVTDHSSVLFTSQIVNKFLFLTLAGSAVDKLKEMLDNPSQIPAFLAEALPSQSVFFICYIMLATLTGYALQLLRIVPLILVAIKRKWLAKTAREDKLAWKPPPILYDRVVRSRASRIERFHSRHQWACFSTKSKENGWTRIEFNSRKLGTPIWPSWRHVKTHYDSSFCWRTWGLSTFELVAKQVWFCLLCDWLICSVKFITQVRLLS